MVGTGYEIDIDPYPIFKSREDEFHSLHLHTSCEIVPLEFKISTLKANAETTKETVADIYDILNLCNKSNK